MTDLNEQVPAVVPEETPTPEPSVQEKALAAMDVGLAEVAEADEPAVEAEDVVADPAAEAVVEPAKDAKPDDAKPEEKPADANAEAESLGIKNEKAKERFNALRNENIALHAALESVGIKDVADLPQLVETAQMGQRIIDDWANVGVDADGYAGYLAYAQMVQATRSGDMKAAESAFTQVEAEYTALAKLLGKDVGGIADPLADHPDLLADVEQGDITRKHALKLAATRLQDAQRQTAQQAQTTTTQAQQALRDGEAALVAWEQKTAPTDPHYMAKRETLTRQVAAMRKRLPPDQWAEATQEIYEALPNPAPAAAAPAAKPTPGPVRPGRITPPLKQEFESPLSAIDYALSLDDA